MISIKWHKYVIRLDHGYAVEKLMNVLEAIAIRKMVNASKAQLIQV